MTVHNSQASIDVYQKLLDVSETVHTGIQSNEGAPPLSKEQQKLVLAILSEVDISKPELRKHLIGRITAHPKITCVVLRTLSSKDALDADQLTLNQELLRSRIDELTDLYRPYINSRSIFDWLLKYGTCFDKTSLKLLPADDLYQLTGLMHMVDGLGNSETILANLPEQGKQYRQLLNLAPSDFWQQACQMDQNLSQDTFIRFANYVSLRDVSYDELLTFLSQDNLSKLTPHLRYLRFHNVSDDIITKTLETATKAEHVEISSSTIETLPALAHCKVLDCHKCISLTQLPPLPSCQTLNCSECTKLITLPELPSCKKLDCSSCSSLRILPQELPNCIEFNYENCLLSTIPILPHNAQVRSGTTTLDVDFNELASNPRKLLLELDKHLSLHSFPLIRYQTNGGTSQGIDAGGLGRDFISRLMESLFNTTTTDNIPSGKLDRNSHNYPQMKQKEDAQCYRAIGKVFAACYSRSSDCKIGPIFHTDVYKKIALLAAPSLREIDVTSDINIVPIYIQYRGDDFAGFSTLIDTSNNNIDEVSDNALMSAYEMTSDDYYSDRQQTLEHFKNKENREKLKSAVLQAAQEDPQFQAIRLIAQELKNKLNAQAWTELHQRDGEAIQGRIEGVLSKTALINNFRWKSLPYIAMEDQEQNKALENKTKGYVNDWIERASLDDLRTLVRAVTSSNALGPEQLVIELYKRGDKQLPIAHTCSFTLELSVEYPDQKTFDEKLTMFLSEALAGTGFQFE